MFDQEQLKNLAAKAVSNYIARGVTLTDAVAALSKENRLNEEQTKRLVEVSNQVAYLKILETAKDRTFNFPVAEYKDVMAKIATPDVSMNKQASAAGEFTSPMDIVKSNFEVGMEKAASYTEPNAAEFIKSASEQEVLGYLPNIVFSYKAELDKLAYDKMNQAELLVKAASEARKDPFIGYKLQKFASNQAELTRLIGVELEKVASERSPIFKDKDFERLAELNTLFVEAKTMLAREEFLRGELEKLAFSGVIGRVAGSIFGKRATGITSAGVGKALTAYDVASSTKTIAPKNELKRGYEGIAKSAAQGGPSTQNPSVIDNISAKWKNSFIGKRMGGKTFTQKLQGAGTVLDYAGSIPMIRPKDSVWDALHNKGEK